MMVLAAASPPDPVIDAPRLPERTTLARSSVDCRSATTVLANARPLRSSAPTAPPPTEPEPPAVRTVSAALPAIKTLPARTVAPSSHRLLPAAPPPVATTSLARLLATWCTEASARAPPVTEMVLASADAEMRTSAKAPPRIEPSPPHACTLRAVLSDMPA